MKVFCRLCQVTALRTLRDPVTVVFSLAFAPAFIIVMGLIFGNDPTPQFGGRGFLEANFTAFPGIVIAITSAIIVPVDMAAQRVRGRSQHHHSGIQGLSGECAQESVSTGTGVAPAMRAPTS